MAPTKFQSFLASLDFKREREKERKREREKERKREREIERKEESFLLL